MADSTHGVLSHIVLQRSQCCSRDSSQKGQLESLVFIFLASTVCTFSTADFNLYASTTIHCIHEDNRYPKFKSRDITLPTKIHLVKAMVFPVVMYGCESWTVKKAEHRRIDAFELWCWRRLSRVPWAAREIQPVHSEGDQPWDFFGRNDAKAETPVLWPPHVKS